MVTMVTPSYNQCHHCMNIVTIAWPLLPLLSLCEHCYHCVTIVTIVWTLLPLCDHCYHYVTIVWPLCDDCHHCVTIVWPLHNLKFCRCIRRVKRFGSWTRRDRNSKRGVNYVILQNKTSIKKTWWWYVGKKCKLN